MITIHECLCRLGIACLLTTIVVGPTVVPAAQPPDEDYATFCKKELAEIEAKLAALPAGAANRSLLMAAKSVATDMEIVVAQATEALDRVRSAAVGGMVTEAIGASSKKPARAEAQSHVTQIRDLYAKYQDRIAKAFAATSANTPEAKAARQYIERTLVAAEAFILNRASKLGALGEGSVAAEWATLVPLLARGGAGWNKEMVAGLPDWMRKMQSLRAAEHLCLCCGRPKAAYPLWVYQVAGDKAMPLGVDNYLANLHRRANAGFGSKDFLKGIAILKAIIVLADAEKMTDEAVKSRFRLAEVYTMYGHGQLAADEMKSLMTAYPDHKEHGRAALTRLRYLYESSLYEKIIQEAPAMVEAKAAEKFRPQILYVAWVANRRQNKVAAADDLQKRLIRDYPEHPLCADLYFATAMNRLAAGDYAGAQRLLEMVSEKYAKTSIADKCRKILSRIRENQKKASPAPRPSGA